MSLYNMLFGTNPAADILLAMLGLGREDTGRFRDCFLNDDGTEITIHTRNGGGNRESYQTVIDELAKHPCYLRDSDDDFDCTYADIVFKVPEAFAEAARKIADATDTTPPAERWKKLLSDMHNGNDTAVVSRAINVGKQIFGALDSKQNTTEVKTPEGSVTVKRMN